MIKENHNINIGIDFFYDSIKNSKFKKTDFLFPLKTRKKRVSIDKALYKKIILSFLNNYFESLYESEGSIYFFLSGDLVKNRTMFYDKHKNREVHSVVWTWFNRPNISYMSNIRIIKQKGSSSRIKKIEDKYKENNDISLLLNYKQELINLVENKSLYND